jgi:ABC-2 type transport system ATP-binding protein
MTMATGPATAGASRPGDAPAAIRTHGLTKRFGSILAVDQLDLDVPAGSVFGFLGPNGAGKTTTLRMLTGLARPSAGSAEVAGIPIGLDRPELRRRLGYLDQDPRYYGWMRGRELLELVGRLAGLDGPELRARTAQMLDRTGLTEAANRRIGGYSGGMRQRLGIAQALIHQPAIVFLDEPVSSLDPEGRRDVLELIARLRGEMTVVLSTHVLADVERVCDRVAILDRGRLVIEAGLEALLAEHARPIYRLVPERGQEAAVGTLTERLAAAPWAGGIDREPGGIVRVAVQDDVAASAGILPLVVEAGVRLAEFERVRPTLEDVFLELVGPTRAEDLDGRGFVRPREASS